MLSHETLVSLLLASLYFVYCENVFAQTWHNVVQIFLCHEVLQLRHNMATLVR